MRNDIGPRLWITGVALLAAVLSVAAVHVQLALRPDVLGLGLACSMTFIGLFVARRACGPLSPLSPLAFVAYCQVLIFIARPSYAMYYQGSANIFTQNEYDGALLTAQAIAGAGFLALCLGYSMKYKKVQTNEAGRLATTPFDAHEWSRIAPALYGVVAIGYGLYAIYIQQIGWSGYWSATLSGRSQELRTALSTNSGYLYSGLQFATGAILLIIFQSFLTRKNTLTLALIGLLGISMFPQIAAGSRSVFIPVIVAMLYIICTVRPGILRFSRFVVWGPILFLLGFVAPRIWRDNLAVGGTVLDSLRVAMSPENLFDNFFGGLDTAMIDAFALQIEAQTRGDLPFQMGGTYLGIFSAVVPRALWPSKPDSVDEILNAALFPETDAKNIGFAFGFYSEPYFNFGLIGVIMVCFLMGLGLASLANRANNSNDLVSAFILMMVVAYIFPIMRGSLSFDSQRLLISLLPVILVLLIVRPRFLPVIQDGEKPLEALPLPKLQRLDKL